MYDWGWAASYVRLFARLLTPNPPFYLVSNGAVPGTLEYWGDALPGGLASSIIAFPAVGKFPYGLAVHPD